MADAGVPAGAEPAVRRPTVGELARVFLRLGLTAFGGPAAHIAIMEDELVQRRRWLTRTELLDLVAAANLIPGPNSTEVAIHIGLRSGWVGFLVAGACFILPAALLVATLAWAYTEFGHVPAAAGVLFGVKPVVIAVVLQALVKFGRDRLTSWPRAAVVLLAAVLSACGVDELAILAGAGLLVLAGRRLRRLPPPQPPAMAVMPGVLLGAANAVPPAVGLGALFLVFLKIGSVLFGSGYVLLAFLRTELVERRQWLTEGQLLDAVAVGQVTPGPVFTAATFIGYLLGGPAGAAAATVGIFLPAFVFVALSGPLLSRLRRAPDAAAFLDGVVLASLALMAVVTGQLAWAALEQFDVTRPAFWVALALFAASAVLLMRFRVNSAWLVLGAALVGWGWAMAR